MQAEVRARPVMADQVVLSQHELFELSLLCSPHNLGNSTALYQNDDDSEEDFRFDLDQSLLIDRRNLLIGPMIGEGPYTSVHEGLYESKPVAVKMIQPNRTSAVSSERKKKFQREVILLSRAKHENVVKFVGASVEPSMILVMELMRGGTLQKYLWSLRPERLDLKLSISFALDISRVMEYLHANGIIHRDLKPSNLLLSEDKKQIKVADFGLAREMIMDEMTSEAGTYRWMAPELFCLDPLPSGAKKHYDHKVDVYSFSIVLWELLTSKIPFKGRSNVLVAYAASKNHRPSLENLPEDIASLIQSCWAEDPKCRPEFREITGFLTNFLHNLGSTQTTPPEAVEVEAPKSNTEEESVSTSHVMNKSGEKAKKKKRKFLFPSFFRCFVHCSSA